jgi:DsbC/DsbD-like thiol-disulfide interchange protein
MGKRIAAIVLSAWLICLSAAAHAAAPKGKDLVKATLLADTSAIRPGQPFQIGVMLKIVPNWHLYWLNPGDGGIPTTIDLKLPDGFTASPWQYPTPQRFDQAGGLISYGYEHEAMIIATVTPPAKIDGSTVAIAAEANWLVCEKVCVPGDVKLNLTLAVSSDAQPSEPDLFKKWLSRMPVPIDKTDQVLSHHVQVSGGKLSLSIEWSNEPATDIQWFPPASQALNFKNIRIDTKGKTTTITADIEQLAGQKIEEKLPDSVIGYASPSGRVGVSVPIKIG